MKTLDQWELEIKKDIDNYNAHFRRHKDLIALASDVAVKWSSNHDQNKDPNGDGRSSDITYARGFSTIDAVSLNLYLGPNDSLQDVQLFIDSHLSDALDKMEMGEPSRSDYVEMKWSAWTWSIGPWDEKTKFMVRAWFEKSTKCTMVGTGKFEEVMKVECQE